MSEARIDIVGRNHLTHAVRQAEQSLKGLLKQGELMKKVFTGGAIVGAVLAFERLAENAEKAAEKIGDRGTAKALRTLNREIDTLKAKGLNVIGQVLGDVSVGIWGSNVAKEIRALEYKIKEGKQKLDGGLFGFVIFGPGGRDQLERDVAAMEARLKLLRTTLPYGDRTRAPGSRGGGSAVTARPDLIEPKVRKAAYDDSWLMSDPAIGAQRAWMDLGETIDESMASIDRDLRQWSKESFENLTQPVIMAEPVWTAFAEQGARNIQDAFAQFLFDPLEDGFRGMLASFVDTIRQMLAQYIAFQAITGLGSFLSGTDSKILQGIGGFLQGAGKRASGGPVVGGGAYLVGERGPELFVPRSSGTIVPNGAGGVSLSYQIDARGADAERIMAMMPGLLKRTKDETVAAMIDLQRRGRFA